MKHSKRSLAKHLTNNVASKCFVFRHPNFRNAKSVVFSYARAQDYQKVKRKAVAYTRRMNKMLGPVQPSSDSLSVRNRSGIVGVSPKRKYFARRKVYYFWNAKWKDCELSGGVSWPCATHTDKGAYTLAALTVGFRSTERERIMRHYKRIKGTSEYKKILSLRPKIPIERFWRK